MQFVGCRVAAAGSLLQSHGPCVTGRGAVVHVFLLGKDDDNDFFQAIFTSNDSSWP